MVDTPLPCHWTDLFASKSELEHVSDYGYKI